jgi:general secretion pathway protein G
MWAKHKQQTGFTIVELLIVIVVIGILAAITIVAYNGMQDRARTNGRIVDLKNIQKSIELYYAQNGSYPSTGNTWLFQRNSGDSFIPGVVPTFISKLPSVNDGPTGSPTDNSYVYNSTGADYKLIRYLGAGIPAGEWANVPAAMIDSWGSTHKDRYGVWSPGGAGF